MIHHRSRRVGVSLVLLAALTLVGLAPAAATVAHAAASIHVSRATVAQGDTITVTGSGFRANDTVTVYADFTVHNATRRVQTAVSADGSGAFSASLTVPAASAPRVYRVTARDFSGDIASQALTVLRLVMLRAGVKAPAVAIIPGHHFFVRGTGFGAGETVALSATFPQYNGNSVTVNRSGTTDKNGNWGELEFPVPFDAKQGSITLTATGQTSKKTATAAIFPTYHPVIYLKDASIRPGGTLTVNGQGYVPNTMVRVAVTIPRSDGSSQTISKDVTTDQYGRFTLSLGLPGNTKPGAYTVSATNQVKESFSASAKLTVSVSASISIQPRTVQPGQPVKIIGSGFSANVSIAVSAAFPLYGGGSKTVSTTVQTDGNGNFTVALTAPGNAASTRVVVSAHGPNTQATGNLIVGAVNAAIALSPSQALPGSTVTVHGSGYLANVRVDISATVTLTDGSKKVLRTQATTNSKGQFAVPLTIPASATASSVTVVARSLTSGRAPSARLTIAAVRPSIVVSPASVIPGGSVSVKGSGYLAGASVRVTVTVKLTNGSSRQLTTSATADRSGAFAVKLTVPGNAQGGSFTVAARAAASGRSSTAHLVVAKLAPSIVAVPTTVVPNTPMTINGFGFAAGAKVTLTLSGHTLGTVTVGGNGQFSLKATVPSDLASGAYALNAASDQGRKASINLSVNRTVSTHFYFASFYTGTGYHESLAFLNPGQIRARVTITYQLTNGSTKSKTVTVNAHSRFTEDVNADLGSHVSASAEVSADVPLAAERMVTHGSDGDSVPGATAPSTVWYFANGNTAKGYRVYLAVQNPNSGPVQVAVRFMPTHSRAFTVYRTMPPTSRTTFKVNSYVHHDAVGMTVSANGPIVVNRTIFVKHGMTSKIGVTAPQRRWYFATGPQRGRARYWIGVINPANAWTHLTLYTYRPDGAQAGTTTAWLKPHARAGYLINKIAHMTNAAVVVNTSRPIVAEQTTYLGNQHNASTDTFGVPAPGKSWAFAAVNTNGRQDALTLFNPSVMEIPVVVQFMDASGQVTNRTYIVGPFSQTRVDVGSVAPNSQLGIVATSNYPFVALNRTLFNGGMGSMSSPGIAL